MGFWFLLISVLGGVSLLGTGYNIGTGHRTTAGLAVGLLGLLVLVLSYGSAVQWGIVR